MQISSFGKIVSFLIIFLCASHIVVAQTPIPKTEIGVHFSYLSIGDFFSPSSVINSSAESLKKFGQAEKGIGGRITYNFNKSFAVEGELNIFRNNRQFNDFSGKDSFSYSREPGLQGLFGPKIGLRAKRFGIFGKSRLGFLRYTLKNHYNFFIPVGVPGTLTPSQTLGDSTAKANLALDLGGVLEFYPSRHTVLRFDIGDTIVRFKSNSSAVDGTPLTVSKNIFINHHPQFNIGVGWRFW